MFKKEVELGALVVAYLEGWGWDVYQEVAVGGRTYDIVGRRGAVIWIVECKLSQSLSLLAQADEATHYAHRVSVAVPARAGSRASHFFEKCLRHIGAGMLRANARYDYAGSKEWCHYVEERIAPRTRRGVKSLAQHLCEGQKRCAPAGSCDGGRWSPWRETLRRCENYVAAHPGCTTKEIIEAVDHHYSSDSTARSSIPKWLDSAHVPGVELRREGGKNRFYPVEA